MGECLLYEDFYLSDAFSIAQNLAEDDMAFKLGVRLAKDRLGMTDEETSQALEKCLAES